jgi:hypothetical protein
MAGAGCSTAAPAGSQTRRFRRRIPRPGTVFSHQKPLTSGNAVVLAIVALSSRKLVSSLSGGPLQGPCRMRAFPMLNLPVHGPTRPEPLLRSIKRHLYAENCSARTPHHLLIAVRQADTFLRGRGTSVHAATRADLEAFVGVQLGQGVLGPGRIQGCCAASSSSARSLGPPAPPWVPLTGRRPRPRTRPRPSADQTWTPHEPPGSAPTVRRRAGLTRPAPNRPAAGH